MNHPRYGNLRKIARKSDHRCHLCHEHVRLALYGRPGTYGEETVGVDHLLPQAHGGDDDPDNLLLAHARCNSIRGVRPVEDVRIALAGTPDAPSSTAERVVVTAVAAVGVGAVVGAAFPRQDAEGRPAFNTEAAVVGGLLTALLITALAEAA